MVTNKRKSKFQKLVESCKHELIRFDNADIRNSIVRCNCCNTQSRYVTKANISKCRSCQIRTNAELYGFYPAHIDIDADLCILVCLECGEPKDIMPIRIARYAKPCCRRCKITRARSDYEDWLIKNKPFIKYVSGFDIGRTKCTHECLLCGHKWDALISNIKNYSGCPGCCNRDHDGLYIWKDDNGYYKIGIANFNKIHARINECARRRNTSVHDLIVVQVPYARNHETILHDKFKVCPYTKESGDGYTEFRKLSGFSAKWAYSYVLSLKSKNFRL